MGSGPQTPNFFLPGAEYFNLAPNRTIALQGRRRLLLRFGNLLTAIPASTTLFIFGQQIIEAAPFPDSAAIYIHYGTIVWTPQDNSGAIQVLAGNIGLALSATTPGGFVAYNLGIQTSTQLAPGGTQNIIEIRDLLITARDIEGVTSGAQPQGALWAQTAFVGKNTDAANPHSVNITGTLIYTRLDGIIE